MSRTNRRHNRQIQRQRRNQGPELLSRVADNKLQQNATEIVTALYEATTIEKNATAANLLVNLAESAEYAEKALARVSFAEKWLHEPQVAELDTDPKLAAPPPLRQLTDGSSQGGPNPANSAESDPADEEIPDAEVE